MAGSGIWRRLGAVLLVASAPLLAGGTGVTSNLEQRLLAAHNRERTSAGIPPLRWSDKLALSAKAWAEHLSRAGRLEHARPDPAEQPQGENLWAGTRGYFTPEAMVGLWIEEKKHFTPGPFPHNSRTGNAADVGHYTQLMWRSSREVGCALARGREEDVLVCRYSDPGNVIGKRPF